MPIANGDLELMQFMVDSDSNSFEDTPEETPLLNVVVHKTSLVNDQDLRHHTDTQQLNNVDPTPSPVENLFNAVQQNNVHEVYRLLQEDGSLVHSKQQTNRFTLVHQAAMSGHTEVLKSLLDHGAKAGIVDKEGRSPLHLAVWFGHEGCVKELLLNEPELARKPVKKCKHQSTIGMTYICTSQEEPPQLLPDSSPLHLACKKMSFECVQLLLEAGVDVNVLDGQGLTPLDVAGEKIKIESIEDNGSQQQLTFLQLIETLISKEAKPTTKPNVTYTQTPMHVAVHLQSTAALKKLIEVGYNKPLNNKLGYTALHLAVRERNEEIMNVLVSEYGKLGMESKNNKGETPLHVAVEIQWLLGVRTLLDNGANIRVTSKNGKTVLHVAAAKLNHVILKELLDRSCCKDIVNQRDKNKNLPIFLSIFARKDPYGNSNLKCVSLFLNYKVDLQLLDSKERTILHCVAETKQSRILQVLFKHDNEGMAKIINNHTENEKTALHIAANKNDAKSAQILIDKGCNLYAKEQKFGETALSLASNKEHCDVMKILLKKDSSLVNIPDSKGLMPIHKACNKRQTKVITALVDAGCDLSAKCTIDGVESTAMDLLIHRVPRSVQLLEASLDASITTKKEKIGIDYKILLSGVEKDTFIQLKVIDALVKTGDQVNQKNLFMHPLVESFLFLQWKRIRKLYYTAIAAYILFVIPFSMLTVLLFSSREIKLSEQPTYTIIILLRILICLSSVLNISHECFITYYKITNSRHFLKRKFSLPVISFVILSIIRALKITFMIIISFIVLIDLKYMYRELATGAILIFWVQFMWLISKVPNYGFYMLMFFEVTSNFFVVLLSFTFLIVGFVIAFYVEFREQAPFSSGPEAFLRTIVMMTSEFEYHELFDKFTGDKFALVFTKIVFFLFMLLVGIVIMNIILAKAISDVKKVDRLRKQAEFLSSYEQFVVGIVSGWFGVRIDPVKSTKEVPFDKVSKFPEQLMHTILEKAYQVNRAIKDQYKELQMQKNSKLETKNSHLEISLDQQHRDDVMEIKKLISLLTEKLEKCQQSCSHLVNHK